MNPEIAAEQTFHQYCSLVINIFPTPQTLCCFRSFRSAYVSTRVGSSGFCFCLLQCFKPGSPQDVSCDTVQELSLIIDESAPVFRTKVNKYLTNPVQSLDQPLK